MSTSASRSAHLIFSGIFEIRCRSLPLSHPSLSKTAHCDPERTRDAQGHAKCGGHSRGAERHCWQQTRSSSWDVSALAPQKPWFPTTSPLEFSVLTDPKHRYQNVPDTWVKLFAFPKDRKRRASRVVWAPLS